MRLHARDLICNSTTRQGVRDTKVDLLATKTKHAGRANEQQTTFWVARYFYCRCSRSYAVSLQQRTRGWASEKILVMLT